MTTIPALQKPAVGCQEMSLEVRTQTTSPVLCNMLKHCGQGFSNVKFLLAMLGSNMMGLVLGVPGSYLSGLVLGVLACR